MTVLTIVVKFHSQVQFCISMWCLPTYDHSIHILPTRNRFSLFLSLASVVFVNISFLLKCSSVFHIVRYIYCIVF